MRINTSLFTTLILLFSLSLHVPSNQAQVKSDQTIVPRELRDINAPPPGRSRDTTPKKNLEVQENVASSLPAVLTDVAAPKSINVGESAQIKITLQNLDEKEVSGLKLIVDLPVHIKLQSSTPQPVLSAKGRYQFSINRIGANQKRLIDLDVVPTQKKGLAIKTELQFSVRNNIQIDVRKPKIEFTVSAPKRTLMAKNIRHQVKITNSGDGDASDVALQIKLPNGTKLVHGSSKRTKIGFLPAGQSREILLETQTQHSGLTEFGYQVLSKNLPPVTQQHQVFFLRPELYVEAKGPKVNFVNREGIYSISVKNPSDVPLSNTKVVIEMPNNMEITTISRAGDVNNANKIASWKIGHIEPGETELIQFKAKLSSEGDHQCQITVSSDETVSNQFQLKTKIYTRPDLRIDVSNSTGPIRTGDGAEFVISAKNIGSQPAHGVKISVDLPQWITAVESTQYSIDQKKQQIVFNALDLDVNQNVKLKFRVIGKQGGNFVVRTNMSHSIYPRPLISETSLFVMDKKQEKVGQSSSANSVNRK